MVGAERTSLRVDGTVHASRRLPDGGYEKGTSTMSVEQVEATLVEPNPAFGSRASIARKDRDRPPTDVTP